MRIIPINKSNNIDFFTPDLSADFSNIIHRLSKRFSNIQQSFQFPKLNNTYISDKNYLPYVRGTKYDEIGSLGAVTLVNIAYFLSIFRIKYRIEEIISS